MKDILWLRIISILSSGSAVFFASTSGIEVLVFQSYWHIVFIFINLYRLFILVYQRYILRLDDFEQSIFEFFKSEFTPSQIKQLVSLSLKLSAQNDDVLVKQNEKVPLIGLLLSGEVVVIKNNVQVKVLSKGDFFGEFSFVSGELASSDVKVVNGIEYLCWDQNVLKNYLSENDELYSAFHRVIAKNLSFLLNKFSEKVIISYQTLLFRLSILSILFRCLLNFTIGGNLE